MISVKSGVPKSTQGSPNLRRFRDGGSPYLRGPQIYDTVLTSAGPQIIPFHRGQYRADNGNLRKFRHTNPYGTAFPQKECLHQIEATGMDIPKMYCSSPWRNRTYRCGSAKLPRFMGGSIGPRMEICENPSLPIPMVPRLHHRNIYRCFR